MRLAAVAGREFAVDTVERASGQAGDTVLDALQDAIRGPAGRGAPRDPGRLRFSHALIRDTLYDGLAAGERCRRHAEIASALEAAYAADPEPYLGRARPSLLRSRPARRSAQDHRLLDVCRVSSREVPGLRGGRPTVPLGAAAARGVPGRAAPRRVLVLLGDALARAGDQQRSKDSFLAAASIAARIDDAELLARSAIGYGGRFPWARAGNDGQLVPLLRQALDALPDTDDPLRARLLARLAGALRDQPSTEPRASLGAEAVAMARRPATPTP